jgi:type VI secretion system protein ImpJ
MVARELVFASQTPGDAERILKLSVLNGIQPRLQASAFTAGLTPLQIYLDLCGFAGQVAIFRGDRRPPELPVYNHENLGACFVKTIELIQLALEDVELPPFVMRYFTPVGERVEVKCEREWLSGEKEFYLGVETELQPRECEDILKGIHMKIASADRVDDCFKKSQPALQPVLELRVPRGLPSRGNLVYFQINRKRESWTPREEVMWKDVVRSGSLAIRVSLEQADLDPEGVLTLKLNDGRSQRPRMRFALYVPETK